MTDSNENTWLPNLVGGVSIWKLAIDLNEPKFFDGRLLVPETEGSESLPVTVRWDLTGLTPLKEAQGQWPEEVGAAVRDFQSALDRVAKVFSTPNSGFDKYKQAFTVPALDAEGSANYFYSNEKKKLFVINWGASPRSMGGKAEYVFGFQDWGKVFDHSAALSSAPSLAVANATGENAVVQPATDEKKEGEKKAEEKKKDDKERPWWIWPLFALIAIALVLLALFLMRGCEPDTIFGTDKDAAADALADGAGDEAGADAATEGGADAVSDGGEAGADAMADGGDAGADAMADGGDAGADAAGKDGGLTMDDDDDDLPGGGGGGGGGGGKVIVKTFPGGGSGPGAGARTSVHRRHYHEEATGWRVLAGTEKVARTEDRGHRYDVWLAPGKTFEGVRVEWQDNSGKWHAH